MFHGLRQHISYPHHPQRPLPTKLINGDDTAVSQRAIMPKVWVRIPEIFIFVPAPQADDLGT